MNISRNNLPLLLASLLGLAVAVLSGLSEHVDFLRDWCAWLSGGCRLTATFTLFTVKVWIWGAAFYAVTAASVLFAPPLLAWLIPAAIGVELVLVGIMALIGAVCVFCLVNALVVVLLAALYLRRARMWQAVALTLLAFIVSGALLASENGLVPWYCARVAPRSGPPPVTHADIPLDGSQALGPVDAPVTIVQFSDFRCPACRRMHPVVAEAMKEYGPKVRWVFKNFPLPSHKDAAIAAEGGQCAAAQGRFWEYQDALYATEEEFTPDSLTALAGKLGLDEAAFRKCLDSGASKAQVEKELKSGMDAGITAIPSFVINGTVVTGSRPAKEFKALIEAELAKKGAR